MSELEINANSDRLKNLLSFTTHPKDVNKLPSSQRIKRDSTTWNVFLTQVIQSVSLADRKTTLLLYKQCFDVKDQAKEKNSQETQDSKEVEEDSETIANSTPALCGFLNPEETSMSLTPTTSQVPLNLPAKHRKMIYLYITELKRPPYSPFKRPISSNGMAFEGRRRRRLHSDQT